MSLKGVDRESAQAQDAILRELRSARADYRKELRKVIGASGLRKFDGLRDDRANRKRSERIRRSISVLQEIGIDRSELDDLRRSYLATARDLLPRPDISPPQVPIDTPCDSPWVTYQAPYSGYFWSFRWERDADPSDPVLTRYLDRNTGRIGSRIDTKDDDAGDDDWLNVDYYTALNVWHTPLITGPLEVYLAFEFRNSPYSGTVRDEFGLSTILYSQLARARMVASDANDPVQTEMQESLVYNRIEFLWGEDDDWSLRVAKPQDQHWYHFKTAATFQQGSSVLLEAGIRHLTWFETDDESIETSADLDLRLDRIMVRSCRGELIL